MGFFEIHERRVDAGWYCNCLKSLGQLAGKTAFIKLLFYGGRPLLVAVTGWESLKSRHCYV